MRIRVFLHSPLCSVLPDDPQPHTSLLQRQSQNTLFLHILEKAQANPSTTHIKKDNLPLTLTLQHESGHPIPLFPNGEDSGHYKRRLFREDKYESGLVTAKDDALLSFEQELDLRETNLGIQEGKCDTNYSFALNGNSSDANLGVEESETSANYIGFTLNEGRDHTQLYTSVLDHATLEEENADILIIENFPSTSGWPSANTLKAASDELREPSSVGKACTNNTFSRNNVINRRTHLNRCEVSRSWEKLWQYEEESNAKAPTLSEESYGETINNVLDIAKGLPKNVTLQEKLDDFYGRIDVICGNAILYRLMKESLYWPALSCFEWMRLHTPSLLDPRSLCTIFTMLGEANMVDRAIVLFENLKDCNELLSVQVFNALLSALSKHERFDEAEEVFREMSKKQIEPDSVTSCILINLAHQRGLDVEAIWRIFCDMEEQKVFAGHEVFGVLIKAFCQRGMLEEGLKLMAEMERRSLIPNVTIYNIMIDSFGKAFMLEEAEGLISEMKAKGIQMSVVTYNSLIAAYANQGQFETAEAILEEMFDKGLKPTVQSYTTLMTAYGRRALSEKASATFLRMKKNGVSPNIVSYSALIHAFAESGWHKKAEYAFQNMLREGFIPTVEIYTSLLHGYRQAGDVDNVKRIWKEMRHRKCIGTRVTFNVLMDAFAKQGCYAEARDVMYEFNKIGYKPDRKTYNMLINAYARGFRHSKLQEILKEMREKGIHPDSFTYTTLIYSLFRVRDFSTAFKYHEEMCMENQLPDELTYRKLRFILDEKLEVRAQRNMQAVLGLQRKQYIPTTRMNNRKHLWERRKAQGQRVSSFCKGPKSQ